jgi:hypothetical protein
MKEKEQQFTKLTTVISHYHEYEVKINILDVMHIVLIRGYM